MRALAFPLIAIALLAVAPLSADAIPPYYDPTLTIDAKPNPLTFGHAPTISGRLTGTSNADRPITLEANPIPYSNGGFQDVATANTDANGNYLFKGIRPTINTQYRTVTPCFGGPLPCPLESIPCPVVDSTGCTPGATSRALIVEVRMKVALQLSDRTPAAGERIRLFGKVTPEHDGRTVYVLRRTPSGGWVNVKHTVLKDAGTKFSRFSLLIRARRDFTYRAVVFHDLDHAQGTSNRKRLNVH
jgi:hypothetical protein